MASEGLGGTAIRVRLVPVTIHCLKIKFTELFSKSPRWFTKYQFHISVENRSYAIAQIKYYSFLYYKNLVSTFCVFSVLNLKKHLWFYLDVKNMF